MPLEPMRDTCDKSLGSSNPECCEGSKIATGLAWEVMEYIIIESLSSIGRDSRFIMLATQVRNS